MEPHRAENYCCGGLVELIANAMVGIKESFIKCEEHQTYIGEDS
jgi:hypothetical protein